MNLAIVMLVAVLALAWWHFRRRDPIEPKERQQWVIDAFARRTTRQWLLMIPVGLVFVGLMWSKRHPDPRLVTWLSFAGMAVTVGGVAFSLYNWRCPACGAYLGKYGASSGRCPRCHTALR